MALFLYLFVLSMFHFTNNAAGVPTPDYKPSLEINSIPFSKPYKTLWGYDQQKLDDDGTLTIKLDSTSGGGFKSRHSYTSGYFGAQMKLPDNAYTAGIDISLYLSNNQKHKKHDEVDIEFLGNIEGKPYVLQTNVYINGSGDGPKLIGREMKFNLWFDPKEDFGTYAIVYNPTEIIFFVNDVPIRQYQKKSEDTFPMRPMSVYGSIWDASDWATDNGKYTANFAYQPFIAQYRDFKVKGCHKAQSNCDSPLGGTGLSEEQYQAMMFVQQHYMTYNYCTDPARDLSLTPECQN